MKNFIKEANNHEWTAPTGGVVSGTPYLIGSIVVIAGVSAAQGLPFNGLTTGVFEVDKVSAQAWTEGVKVYWDNTAKNFTTTVSTNTLVGVAAAAAQNPSAKGLVLMDGAAR